MVEKTLRSVLACFMAVVLIVCLLPVMPREGLANVSDNPQDIATVETIDTSPVVQFDEQEGTSIALLENGSLWTWGNNDYGAVGDGTTDDRERPLKLLENIKEFSFSHSNNRAVAAISEDCSLWIWGANGDGQAGNGEIAAIAKPSKVLEDVAYVEFGQSCCFAVRQDGSLWGWGFNGGGQVGNGSTENCLQPVKILGNVKSFHTGGGANATCLAITDDDALYMWGWNASVITKGERGGNVSTPTLVMENVKQASFPTATLQVLLNDGTLWSWGANNDGDLGIGLDWWDKDAYYTPTKILENVSYLPENLFPGAVTTDGALWLWGDNSDGQVGCGANQTGQTSVLSPRKVLDDFLTSVGERNGNYTTTVVLDSNDNLWTWGNNQNGTCGRAEQSDIPQIALDNVRTCTRGSFYLSIFAVKQDNSLWAWGENDHGEIGNGDTGNIYNRDGVEEPYHVLDGVQLVGMPYLNQVASALMLDGSVMAWGGSTSQSENWMPRTVIESGITELGFHYSLTSAISQDGSLYLWGLNDNGQIGDGSVEDRLLEPYKVTFDPTGYEPPDEPDVEEPLNDELMTYLAAVEFSDVCAKFPGSSVIPGLDEELAGNPSVWAAAAISKYSDSPIWDDSDVTRSDLAVQELDGWNIVGSSNSPNYLVYAKDGQCIIAFASKDNFDFRGYEDYVKNAEIVYEDAVDNYGADNVFVTGAGLGGALASYVCTLHDAEGAIFNSSGTGFDTAFVNNYADITGFEGVDAMKCVHYYTPEYVEAHSDDDSTDSLHSFPYALVSSNGKPSEAESLSAMYSYADGEFSFNGVINEGVPSESGYRFVDTPSELFETMFAILRGDWTAPLDPKWDFLYAGTSADDAVDVTFLENAMPLTVLAGDSGNGADDVVTGAFGDTIVSGPGRAELDGGLGTDTFVVSEGAEDVVINDYTNTGISTLVALKQYFDVANAFSNSGVISWDGAKGTYKLLKHIAENGIFQTDKVYLEGVSFDEVEVARVGDYLALEYGGTKVWVNEHRYFGQDLDIIDKDGEVRKSSDLASTASTRTVALSEGGQEPMIAQIALQGAKRASVVDRATGAVLLELASDNPIDEYKEYGYFHVEDDGAFRFVYDASLVDVEFAEGTIDKLEALSAEGDRPATIQSQAIKEQIDLGTETLEATKAGQELDLLIGGDEADLEREDVSTSDRDAVQLSADNVADVPEQEWTGRPVEPKPAVSVDGVGLVEGTDFDYSWINNTDEGTATVVVTGKGAYTGQVAKEFAIKKAESEEPGTGPDPGDGTDDDPSGPSQPTGPSGGTSHTAEVEFDAALGDVSVSPESAKAGETVTVTAVPLPGYEVGSVTATDASGKAVGVAEADGGKWTFEMPDGDVDVAVEFAPTPWENPFSDVSEDDWFYDQVRRANLLGLMKGYDGTALFGPDDGLMREQAATVMWNLMGAGDVSRPGAPQADVDQSQWYAPYVNWAVDSKVMDGYSEDDFGVGDSLTREQFAAVVAKAVGADVDSADQAALGAFPDADGVSGWARATMAWAVENGLVNGVETEDGARELQAGRTLTRAEMAAMMMNAIDKGVLKLSE